MHSTTGAEVIEHVWIPLADGTRLAARIWLPLDAREHPVPAIFEYLPYRLSEGTAVWDHAQMHYFVRNGYAGVRVDIRGSGNSDGPIMDEYCPQEQADALEVLRWIAAQEWCDGAIGMIGTSWGGFNGLQIAAHAPPELKAVASYFASDDRYGDDVHYRGGCVLGMDMLHWSVSMLSFLAQPPLPWVVGEGYRQQWVERLESIQPLGEIWLAHQRRDAYWQHGSVRDDYSRHHVRRDGDRRLDRRLHGCRAAADGGPRRPAARRDRPVGPQRHGGRRARPGSGRAA